MIAIRDVTKRFGSTVVVDGLSVELRKPELTGFLGPNGDVEPDVAGEHLGWPSGR